MHDVTIPIERYRNLIKDEYWRQCLESGGIDNWNWYSESLHCEDYDDISYWDFEEEVDKGEHNPE